MPSSKLLKAANTEFDGETGGVVFLGFCTLGGLVGDASVSVDLVTVFGVGEGFGSTTRVRVVGCVDELLFCADAITAHANATVTTTRNLFSIISSPN
jgi:hypothetical protein